MVAVTALSTLGEVYLGIKDFARAEEYLLQALALSRQHKARSDEFQCQLNLGKLYQALQNDEATLAAFECALALSHACNDRRGESQCHQLLSEEYEKRGEHAAALQHFKQFHTLKETVFNEHTAKRLAGLQVTYQVETAKRDAEIHYLKTIELRREIEERKSAQANLENLATHDFLTGLLNRREFFQLGEQELARALQAGQPLTAILFDLDHFKQVNDYYGHAIGDQALIFVTKALNESLRQGELIGRYGGDEFAILLPGSNSAQGRQVAERLRERMASEPISTPKGGLFLTLSLGIADLREGAQRDPGQPARVCRPGHVRGQTGRAAIEWRCMGRNRPYDPWRSNSMNQQNPKNRRKFSAILTILAGVVFLAASFNPLGATPGPGWLWLVIGVVVIGMGVWGLLRKKPGGS